jgi:hypothetical protein
VNNDTLSNYEATPMSESPENTSFVADFLAQLEAVPWFSNIGKPIEAGSDVERIYSWEGWPGPEDPSILELCTEQQDLYDAIMEEAGSENAHLLLFWEQIHAVIFRVAAPTVPYDANRDSWHAPSAAVWAGAWTAGLIGLCRYTNRPVPRELAGQWSWFVKGHWPSGYAGIGADGKSGRLLVY